MFDPLIPLSISNEYIPIEYHYKLDINHQKPNFNGVAIITIDKNHHQQISHKYKQSEKEKQEEEELFFSITLHANKLVIISATIGDEKLSIKYDKLQQRVTFLSSTQTYSQLVTNNCLVMEVKYMGQIKTINTYKDETQGLFKTNFLDNDSGKSDNYILTTHFQPMGAKQVFPIIDELTHKPMIKLDLKTLKKFQVFCNGDEEDVVSNDDEWKISKFVYSKPIHPAITGFLIGDFTWQLSKTVKTNNVEDSVRVYAPSGEISKTNMALRIIENYLPKLEAVFGKYPLNHLYFVAVPFLKDGVMENWSMINVIAPNLLINDGNYQSNYNNNNNNNNNNNQPETYQLTELIVHELVHQWIGNWVSFDNWGCLWFNEAFATWAARKIIGTDTTTSRSSNNNNMLAIDCFYDDGDGDFKIGSIFQYMERHQNPNLNATTESIFSTNIYEKGIILLDMIDGIFEAEGKNFLKQFANKIIEKYQSKTIKIFDIWQNLNDDILIDLPSFVYSWTRSKGYPLLRVTHKQNDNDSLAKKIVIEQHTYFHNITTEKAGIEDTPYHIPLFIKAKTTSDNNEDSSHGEKTKLINLMMTDRSIELDIDYHQLININTGHKGYYRVLYDQLDVGNLSLMDPKDIITIISDLGTVIGTPNSNSQDLINFIILMSNLLKLETQFNWEIWECALSYLEPIIDILRHFSEFNKFNTNWLNKFVSDLFNAIKWDNNNSLDNISKNHYNSLEWKVRSSILQLQLNINNNNSNNNNNNNNGNHTTGDAAYKVAHKYYQNFMNSGINKKFTPKELLPAIFNVTMNKTSMKEYKKVLELVKNANVSLLKQTNATQQDLQTLSLTSLSFVYGNNSGSAADFELVNKTLNFVNNNIDSKLIELGLIGFTFTNNQQIIDTVFHWFKLNYDNWIMRSLRKGSDWSKQIGITIQNIMKMIIMKMMVNNEMNKLKLNEFIQLKLKNLPNHGLKELVDDWYLENKENIRIGTFYNDLCDHICQ